MIHIKGVHKNLSGGAETTVYVAPSTVMSATVSCGSIEVTERNAIATVSLYIKGVNEDFFVISKKEVPFINSPLILPKFTLNAGQELACTSNVPISIILTVGEQR